MVKNEFSDIIFSENASLNFFHFNCFSKISMNSQPISKKYLALKPIQDFLGFTIENTEEKSSFNLDEELFDEENNQNEVLENQFSMNYQIFHSFKSRLCYKNKWKTHFN